MLNDILFASSHTAAALASPTLLLVLGNWATLDVVGGRERHHHLFVGDQIFVAHLTQLAVDDFGTALVTIVFLETKQFVPDDLEYLLLVGQDTFQLADECQ